MLGMQARIRPAAAAAAAARVEANPARQKSVLDQVEEAQKPARTTAPLVLAGGVGLGTTVGAG